MTLTTLKKARRLQEYIELDLRIGGKLYLVENVSYKECPAYGNIYGNILCKEHKELPIASLGRESIMTTTNEKLLQNDQILGEMVRRLVTAFQPECIYLFGSRAREEEGPDSDYDLMMVIAESSLPRYQREQKAFRTLCGLGVSKGVIVLTRKEFDSRRSVVCSLPATVEREGRLLYAA